MAVGARSSVLTVVACLLAEICTAAVPPGITVLANLQIDKDYQGAVHSVAFDAKGDAWIATSEALYKVVAGDKPRRVDGTQKYFQRALAPGGGVYAGLVTGGRIPAGLFTVDLVPLSGSPTVELKLDEFPYGCGTLHLGGAGQLIVTVTPLDSPEGLGGRFLYVFWSTAGKPLKRVVLEGRSTGVIDVGGDAILLLGEKDAIAFSHEGQQLWRVEGRFRKGALGANGSVALLNPADRNAVNEVHVVGGGTVRSVNMPSTVYDLALNEDGSVAAVAINRGALFFLSPMTCTTSECEPRALTRPLPVDGTFLVTAMQFINPTTLAVGVIRRTGCAADYRYPSGAALVVDTSGEVPDRQNVQEVTLEQPATWAPFIDVTYGMPFFAARTPHRALLFSLGP